MIFKKGNSCDKSRTCLNGQMPSHPKTNTKASLSLEIRWKILSSFFRRYHSMGINEFMSILHQYRWPKVTQSVEVKLIDIETSKRVILEVLLNFSNHAQ